MGRPIARDEMGWEKKRSSHCTARHASCSLACLIGSARLAAPLPVSLFLSPSPSPNPAACDRRGEEATARPPGPSSLVRTAAQPLPSRSAPFPSLWMHQATVESESELPSRLICCIYSMRIDHPSELAFLLSRLACVDCFPACCIVSIWIGLVD